MSKHTNEASARLQQLWDWELDAIYDKRFPDKAKERKRLEQEEGYGRDA